MFQNGDWVEVRSGILPIGGRSIIDMHFAGAQICAGRTGVVRSYYTDAFGMNVELEMDREYISPYGKSKMLWAHESRLTKLGAVGPLAGSQGSVQTSAPGSSGGITYVQPNGTIVTIRRGPPAPPTIFAEPPPTDPPPTDPREFDGFCDPCGGFRVHRRGCPTKRRA